MVLKCIDTAVIPTYLKASAAVSQPSFFYPHDLNFVPVNKKTTRIFRCPGAVIGFDRNWFHELFSCGKFIYYDYI
jgi:hypothetical protein